MVLRGAERYGAYYVSASALVHLLTTGFVKTIDGKQFIFILFMSHVRKHLNLALFSTLRLHHVQAMMNLRQVLEAGACAAYAIANQDLKDFADVRPDGSLDPSDALKKTRYKWLDENYRAGSTALKGMKEAINRSGPHADVVSAQHNFKADFEAGRFDTPFFDIEDELQVKTALWQIGNIAMGLMDLFYGVNAAPKSFVLKDDWRPMFDKLVAEDTRLKNELFAHERFKRFGHPPPRAT